MDSTTQELKSEELMKAHTHVLNHMCSFISSMSLKCAVELGIPDVIYNHGKPILLSELAESLSLPSSKTHALSRLMRLLTHSGFFTKQKVGENQDEEGFILTPSSKLLLKDNSTNKYSLSYYVLNLLNPDMIKPCHSLGSWFQGNGSTAFEAAHGMTFWNFMGQNPEYGRSFNEAMTNDSRLLMSVIVKDCKSVFENLKSLIDVGGGEGVSAQAIAEAFPNLKCSVLDLPYVVANLQGTKSLDFITGDMFESIPPANAILLKNVLHDWGDNECVKILRKCKEAIPSKDEGGKVIIIEIVMKEDKEQEKETIETQMYYDMFMLTMYTSGRERSENEWKKIFTESGFSDYKIIPLFGFRSLIEVYP